MNDFSFQNNFWAVDRTGMDDLLNYMYSTHDELSQLYTVYTKRAQLEYEYSQTLLNLSHLFINKKNVYHALHLELEQTSKSHIELSNQLQADVAFHLRNKLDEYELLLKKWRLTLEELFDEREQLTLKLLKIQAKYLKEHELSNGKSTPLYDSIKEQYKYSVAEVNNISEEWNVVWKDACRTLEAMEEDRVEFIKTNMWDYANKISESLLVQDNWCENIRLALEKYTIAEEIKNCIKNHGVGSKIPTTKDYVDYVYQSQKAKKNRKEKLGTLRESLRVRKQQNITPSKDEKNFVESLGRSKSVGDLTEGNNINYKIQESLHRIKQSSITKHPSTTQKLCRSDSSGLPRQPYEYKPDTGSFPNRKSSIDSSFVNNNDVVENSFSSSSTTVIPSINNNNILPLVAPRSPRPPPRPSPYSSPNVSNHLFGQSYPPSSYFQQQQQQQQPFSPMTPLIPQVPYQQQQPFSNQNEKSPLVMPQNIPLLHNNKHVHHHQRHPSQYRYKSAPCSPIEQQQGFVFPIQTSDFTRTKSFHGTIPLPTFSNK